MTYNRALLSIPSKSSSPRAHIGLRGFYTLEVQAPGGPRRKVAEFENLLLDVGLNEMGGDATYLGIAYCSVGTGINQTPPQASDTQLEAYLASTNVIGPDGVTYGAAATAPYYGWHRTQFQFDPGVATGILTEVGSGSSATGDMLLSRALIVNAQDVPTAITILANETLYVTYELRTYPVAADNVYSLTVDGLSRTITVRGSQVTTGLYWAWRGRNIVFGTTTQQTPAAPTGTTGDIGLITASPSGTAVTLTNNGMDPYANNSFARVARVTVPLNEPDADNPGLKSMALTTSLGRYQVQIDPAVVKGPLNELRIAMTWSWGRYVAP